MDGPRLRDPRPPSHTGSSAPGRSPRSRKPGPPFSLSNPWVLGAAAGLVGVGVVGYLVWRGRQAARGIGMRSFGTGDLSRAISAVMERARDSLVPLSTTPLLYRDEAGRAWFLSVADGAVMATKNGTGVGGGAGGAGGPHRGRVRDVFASVEHDLVLGDVFSSHEVVLNKFPVLPGHLVLFTKAFKPQVAGLSAADLGVAMACLCAEGGLAFFNGGPLAGASQPRRHIQYIPASSLARSTPTASLSRTHLAASPPTIHSTPLPLPETSTPKSSLLPIYQWILQAREPGRGGGGGGGEGGEGGGGGGGGGGGEEEKEYTPTTSPSSLLSSIPSTPSTLPWLGFRHAIVRTPSYERLGIGGLVGEEGGGTRGGGRGGGGGVGEDGASYPLERIASVAGRPLSELFQRLVAHLRLHIPPDGPTHTQYNLLLTRDFMMLVPRTTAGIHPVSTNALGFAGLLLARGAEEAQTLCLEISPAKLLQQCTAEGDE